VCAKYQIIAPRCGLEQNTISFHNVTTAKFFFAFFNDFFRTSLSEGRNIFVCPYRKAETALPNVFHSITAKNAEKRKGRIDVLEKFYAAFRFILALQEIFFRNPVFPD